MCECILHYVLLRRLRGDGLLGIKMKSITIKGVILVHNEGTFFIIDGFANLLKAFGCYHTSHDRKGAPKWIK